MITHRNTIFTKYHCCTEQFLEKIYNERFTRTLLTRQQTRKKMTMTLSISGAESTRVCNWLVGENSENLLVAGEIF